MKTPLLTLNELDTALTELNSDLDSPWTITNQKLCKSFVFRNFIQAVGFMTQAAIVAEKMNHHPEWSNVYKNVDVQLVTHDSGGITALDFELAGKMEALN